MAAYGLLIYLSLGNVHSFQALSTIGGYCLLFLSKYVKQRDNKDSSKILQTWGYVFVALGLDFDRWLDALAVFAYSLAIADVEASNILIALVLTLNIPTTESFGRLAAILSLIVYNL